MGHSLSQHLPGAERHKVDRLGCAAHEDDLVFATTDKLRHPPSCCFIGQGHVRRSRINAAMDGGIILSHRSRASFDHSLGLLRTRRSIEVMPVANTGELVAQLPSETAALILPAAQCAFGNDRHQNVPRNADSA